MGPNKSANQKWQPPCHKLVLQRHLKQLIIFLIFVIQMAMVKLLVLNFKNSITKWLKNLKILKIKFIQSKSTGNLHLFSNYKKFLWSSKAAWLKPSKNLMMMEILFLQWHNLSNLSKGLICKLIQVHLKNFLISLIDKKMEKFSMENSSRF